MIEFITYDNADKVIEELFESLLSRYQIVLETLMRDSDFIFDCIYLLYYKCQKINLNHGELYIGSPERIKNNNRNNKEK